MAIQWWWTLQARALLGNRCRRCYVESRPCDCSTPHQVTVNTNKVHVVIQKCNKYKWRCLTEQPTECTDLWLSMALFYSQVRVTNECHQILNRTKVLTSNLQQQNQSKPFSLHILHQNLQSDVKRSKLSTYFVKSVGLTFSWNNILKTFG